MTAILFAVILLAAVLAGLFIAAYRAWREAIKGWEESNDTSEQLLAALKRANATIDRLLAEDGEHGEEWKHSRN